MTRFATLLLPTVVGAVLHAALWLGMSWLYSDAIAAIVPGQVVTISMPWLQLVFTVLPGLVAGYLCRNNPFLIGFIAVAIAHLAMFPFSWHPVAVLGDPPLLIQAIGGAVRAGIAGAVAAAAGFLLAVQVGANNSFKPNPLRGSA